MSYDDSSNLPFLQNAELMPNEDSKKDIKDRDLARGIFNSANKLRDGDKQTKNRRRQNCTNRNG